jgi:O-6-methylguanine DNA methyltransferase
MKFKSKTIYTSHIDTPLGGITMAATDQGLAGVWFDQQRHWPDTTGWIAKDDHPALRRGRHAAARLLRRQARRLRHAARPVARHRLPAERVAGAARIPAGKTMTYGALSVRVGNPAAVRAVGAAVGRNPISVIVPCHRVLGSDGSLTGYAGGLHRKTRPPRIGSRREIRTERRMSTTTQNNIATSTAKPWLIDLVLLGALWGASFLFMRIGAAEFGALPTAAVRVAIGALFLLPIALLRGQGPAMRQALEGHLRRRRLQLGNAVRALLLRAADHQLRPRRRHQRHRADVRRAGGVGLVPRAAERLAHRRPGDRLYRRGDAREPQRRPARRRSSNAALWAVIACLGACLCYGISASATRRYLGGVPPLATATGSQTGRHALPRAAGHLALARADAEPARLARAAGAGHRLHGRGVHPVLPPDRTRRPGTRADRDLPGAGVRALLRRGVPRRNITQWMLISAVVIVCGVALSTGVVRLGPKPKKA